MAKIKEPVNPFYVLLVALGVVFFVTAFAYGAMTYLAIHPIPGRDNKSHELLAFLDVHGMQLLGVELGLLAFATFGAMWLDQRRTPPKPAEMTRPTDTEQDPKIR